MLLLIRTLCMKENTHTNYPVSPSGLYWATMVTLCPAFFKAAAACSCVALWRSAPFT